MLFLRGFDTIFSCLSLGREKLGAKLGKEKLNYLDWGFLLGLFERIFFENISVVGSLVHCLFWKIFLTVLVFFNGNNEI